MAGTTMYNLTASDGLTPSAGLGDEVDIGGCRFGYFRANASVALTAYASCSIGNTFLATMGTTTTSGAKPTLFCIPQFAVAVNEYFWAPIGPFLNFTPYNDPTTGIPVTFKVLALTLAAADVKLYTTGTDGAVDDTATDLIAGLALTSTVGGSTAATSCYSVCRMVSNCQD